MATSKDEQTLLSDLPDIGIRWSKTKIAITFFVCLTIAVLGVFGFLLYQEYGKQPLKQQPQATGKNLPDQKNYTNDYWGFGFVYPASWSQVIGSYQEGDYYFASEPINFISELEPGQALLEVQTYNNYKNLAFDDWLKDREENYFPRGILEKKSGQFKNYLFAEYSLKPARPGPNPGLWDIKAVSKDGRKIYLFIFQTDSRQIEQKFQNVFNNLMDSLSIYKGFGN
jgi:hypothetical protein